MDFLGRHGGFILAAYAVTAVVLIGLILAIIWDGRRLRQRLSELDKLGIRRRSDRRREAARAVGEETHP